MGLGFNPAPSSVRDGLLRDAGVEPPLFSVSARCDDWFVVLANELGDTGFKAQFVGNVVESTVSQIPDDLVTAILKLLRPSPTKTGVAGALPLGEMKQVEDVLPLLLRRILKKWNEDDL
jgi:hypothetical protein